MIAEENHVGAGLLGFSLATFAYMRAWIKFSWFRVGHMTRRLDLRLLTMIADGRRSSSWRWVSRQMFESIEHGHIGQQGYGRRLRGDGECVGAQWLRAAKQETGAPSGCSPTRRRHRLRKSLDRTSSCTHGPGHFVIVR